MVRSRRFALSLVCIALLTLAVAPASAEETSWQHDPSTPGDWFEPGNWTPCAPGEGDSAHIDNCGTAQIGAGNTRIYELYLGESLPGHVHQTGGTLTLDWDSRVGQHAAGTYILEGGELNACQMRVGHEAPGLLRQTGGVFNCPYGFTLGYNAGSAIDSAIYEMTGGQANLTDKVELGWMDGSQGTLKIGGSANLQVGSRTRLVQVGVNGNGLIQQTGGTVTAIGDILLGTYTGSHGQYELSHGSLVANDVYIGGYFYGSYGVTGTFLQTGGSSDLGYLSVEAGSSFKPQGGPFQIRNSASYRGLLDFGDADSSMTVGGILDFSQATIANCRSASLTVAANSLLQTPPGFCANSEFASVTNNGIIHETGAPLSIASHQIVEGHGDIQDHVLLAGTIRTRHREYDYLQDDSVHLRGGVFITGAGLADLGEKGSLTVENNTSGMDGGRLSVYLMYVGWTGSGRFTHTGGIVGYDGWTGSCKLFLGMDDNASGTYELSGDGEVNLGSLLVGHNGSGHFIQDGGVVRIGDGTTGKIWLGDSGGPGLYELKSGEVHAGCLHAKNSKFVQSGGMVSLDSDCPIIESELRLENDSTYELRGGTIHVDRVFVAYPSGSGTILHSAGLMDAEVIGLTSHFYDSALYELSGAGELRVSDLTVGYTISSFGDGQGIFRIMSTEASVTIANRFFLRETGVLQAVPGATIHMTGSAFENESTNPENLAGLGNLTLIFEGGSVDIDPFEVAGEDMGAVMAGLESNFALGTLQLGGADIGQLQLVNLFDNQPGWVGSEALYVENLILGAGSMLDLNGLNLYYLSGTFDGAITDGVGSGGVYQVPEPASASLLLLGAVTLLRRRKRKS